MARAPNQANWRRGASGPARICASNRSFAPGGEAQWLCDGCGLRGDLPADSAPNKVLAAKGLQSSSDSSSARSGTRDPNSLSLDASSTLTRLDRNFERMTRHGPPHPLFSGPTAGAAVPIPDAIATVNKAVGASATQRPSEKLIELVRSGKLVSVGFAIPRPLDSGQTGDEANAIGGMLFTDAGPVLHHGKSAPPPVQSAQAFCMALFSTILPSLIDRPAAMLEWMALARTALHIESEPRSSWARANAYIDQLLQRRIPQRKGISEPCDAVLRTLHSTESFAQHGAGGPSRTDRRPDSRRSDGATCNQWNYDGSCPRGESCRFRHACLNCGGQHQVKACTKGSSSASVPNQRPPFRKGGGKGGGSHRSAGASSVTTAKAAPAAASSARQE